MRISTWALVTAVLGCAFLVNALFNHTEPGLALKESGRWYLLLFYVPFGIVVPAFVMGWLRALDAADVVRPPLGRRDLVGVPVALTLAALVTAVPLSRFLAEGGDGSHLHQLFALLLIASLAEVTLFLGVAGDALALALRQRGWGRLPCMALTLVVSSVLFGLFHFTYPSPWNTGQTVLLLSLVWVGVALVYFVTGSLLGAVLFNNAMALVGFVGRDLPLPGSAIEGWARGVMAVALLALIAVSAKRWRVSKHVPSADSVVRAAQDSAGG